MSIIHQIGVAVPPFVYQQEYAAMCMKRWVQDRVMQRMVQHVYRQSGIERRYSVLPDFQPDGPSSIFFEQPDGTLVEPTTGQRNHMYEKTYPGLAQAAVASAFQQTPWITPVEVTHVITVSCTGFCNPGPDLMLVRHFGLPSSAERYHIGFMGCYAAFPALRMADQFCRANPRAVVLIVCVETCSLHLQIKPTTDSLLANALFGDGAAAVLVSKREVPEGYRSFSLDHFATRLIPDSERDMAWTIGDRGFDMVLSSYVPRILGLHVQNVLSAIISESPVKESECAGWAIHPGGKAILHALQTQMGWSEKGDPLLYSHRILRDYGNMSSATILFVLRAIMQESALPHGSPLGTLAFGPGLTVEFGLFTLSGQPTQPTNPTRYAFAETYEIADA